MRWPSTTRSPDRAGSYREESGTPESVTAPSARFVSRCYFTVDQLRSLSGTNMSRGQRFPSSEDVNDESVVSKNP